MGAVDGIRAALSASAGAGDAPRFALMLPLLESAEGLEVLLEVRSRALDVQPGEVCLPGGMIEPGETPLEAAVRETCEELLVDADQLELVGELGGALGPGRAPMAVYCCRLHDYAGSYSEDEVEHVFTLPLEWLLAHDPEVHVVETAPRFGENFPFKLIPGGRAYPWRFGAHEVPFYRDGYPEDLPLVWGATARVLWSFAKAVRAFEPGGAPSE